MPTDDDRPEEERAGQVPGAGQGPGAGEAAAAARQRRRAPVRHVREEPWLTEDAARATAAQRDRPSDHEHTRTATLNDALEGPKASEVDPAAMRRGERIVAALFLLSVLGTLIFLGTYIEGSMNTVKHVQAMNLLLGLGLMLALFGIGAGMVMWVKKLIPHGKGVQEREPMHSTEENELLTERLLLDGAEEMGIGRHKIVRRTLLAALGLLPLPAIFALRDMGPLPKATFRHTAWKKDARLVDLDTGKPYRLGDLAVGSIATVMPENFGDVNVGVNALSPTILIRLPPGSYKPRKGIKGGDNWAPDDHVAYSKICTHAGCPISLYQHQTHHLLCPCHQSTFDMLDHAKVVFGPAARPLPQLPIYVDDEGYFRARSDYPVPVGPSFWERGGVEEPT